MHAKQPRHQKMMEDASKDAMHNMHTDNVLLSMRLS